VKRQGPVVCIALVFALLLLAGPGGCKGRQAGQLTTVRFYETTHSISSTPVYVALEEGFFREQGLDIEISTLQDASSVMTALLSQKVDVVLGDPKLTVYSYQQGGDNYVINFAAVAHTGQAGGKVPCAVLMASKSFIEKHPDVIQKMTDGLYMGQLWVENRDPEETAKALQQFFPGSDLATITWEVDHSKPLGVWETSPVLEYGDFARMEKILVQPGMSDTPVDPGILVTQQFALIATRTIKQHP